MFLKNFKFGSKQAGRDSKTFFIAEIGINHEGNFENCKRMILEAYKSGADAVKLQTIDPEENYAKNTKFYKIFKKSFFNKEQTIKHHLIMRIVWRRELFSDPVHIRVSKDSEPLIPHEGCENFPQQPIW